MSLHLAIAADFTLAEKLLEAIEARQLDLPQISAVEIEPFGEEQNLRLGAKAVPQIALEDADWSQFSHVLFAAPMAQAEVLAKAAQAGCVIIDLFGTTALIGDIPVVVPSVNDNALAQLRERNIVALANPQIAQLALALKPLLNQPLQQVFVSSLLPAAYFGEDKIKDLAGQTARLLNGIPFDENADRIAFDVVPANVQGDEKKLPFSKVFELQLAKVLPNFTACVQFHSVQLPVFYGLAQMVSLQSAESLDLETLAQDWQSQPWLNFNEQAVITPVKNGENEEQNRLELSQLVSRTEQSLQFWSVADEQKFSLAFLGVELLASCLKND